MFASGNPHLERVVLRWEVSFHYNRRAREIDCACKLKATAS